MARVWGLLSPASVRRPLRTQKDGQNFQNLSPGAAWAEGSSLLCHADLRACRAKKKMQQFSQEPCWTATPNLYGPYLYFYPYNKHLGLGSFWQKISKEILEWLRLKLILAADRSQTFLLLFLKLNFSSIDTLKSDLCNFSPKSWFQPKMRFRETDNSYLCILKLENPSWNTKEEFPPRIHFKYFGGLTLLSELLLLSCHPLFPR